MTIVRVPDCSLGVYTDLAPEDLPAGAWTDARNVRFKGGEARAMRGTAQIFTVVESLLTAYWIAPYAQGWKT